MPLTQKLPWMDCDRIQAVRKQFFDRMAGVKDSKEGREALEEEFRVAMSNAKSDLQAEIKQVSEANVKVFLSSPKAVIEELIEEAGRTFDLGEMLIMRGIATATCKRHGKGVMVGIGSDYAHTCSNFTVTAKIGPHSLTEETGGSNDEHSKDRMRSMGCGLLAKKIANGLTPAE